MPVILLVEVTTRGVVLGVAEVMTTGGVSTTGRVARVSDDAGPAGRPGTVTTTTAGTGELAVVDPGDFSRSAEMAAADGAEPLGPGGRMAAATNTAAAPIETTATVITARTPNLLIAGLLMAGPGPPPRQRRRPIRYPRPDRGQL